MTSRIGELVSKSLVTLGSVMAVTALVAVVLMPPMLAQQAQFAGTDTAGAQQQVCLSNMKTLGLALLQYTQDYDEKAPYGTQSTPGSGPTGVGWVGQLYPYTRTVRVLHCPTDPTAPPQPQSPVSYGFNVNMAGQTQAGFTDPAYTASVFEVGHDPVYARLADEGASLGAATFSASGDGTDGTLKAGRGGGIVGGVRYACGYLGHRVPDSPPGQFAEQAGRHHNMPTFAFADGHVASLYPGKVSSGSNAPDSAALQTGGATGTAAGVDDPEYDATFSIK